MFIIVRNININMTVCASCRQLSMLIDHLSAVAPCVPLARVLAGVAVPPRACLLPNLSPSSSALPGSPGLLWHRWLRGPAPRQPRTPRRANGVAATYRSRTASPGIGRGPLHLWLWLAACYHPPDCSEFCFCVFFSFFRLRSAEAVCWQRLSPLLTAHTPPRLRRRRRRLRDSPSAQLHGGAPVRWVLLADRQRGGRLTARAPL